MEQPEGQQFRVVFNKPDESNGPIRLEKEAFWAESLDYWYLWCFCSHYHAVAVKVPLDATLRDPDTDFDSFESINNVYSPACDEVLQTTAYIAAEFGRDEFQDNALQFIFGNEDLNDNPRYSNGPLCYSTSYAFFLRVYNDVVCKTDVEQLQTFTKILFYWYRVSMHEGLWGRLVADSMRDSAQVTM